MRLESILPCSSSIPSFPNVVEGKGQQQEGHLIKSQQSSLPILKKNSTDFSTIAICQKTPANAISQTVNTTKSDSICNEYSSLLINRRDVTCSDAVEVSSIITPPQQKKSLSINQPQFSPKRSVPGRLNKFVRRLHEMLLLEQNSGIVEWRKGLLLLHSTDAFTKEILPKYFGTKNFKTFRRQLNYYGFVHVRSFSATGSTTTALWVNQDLAKRGTSSIASVLMLKRVEPSESSKTAEGRRFRKEEAASTVEDIGINARTIQLEQIRNLAAKGLDKKQQVREVGHVIKIDSNMIVPISSSTNCHESQTGTESTSSNTSSRESSIYTSPVPVSINVTLSYANSIHDSSASSSSEANNSSSSNDYDATNHQSVCDTSTDDAANLLMMFSRSTVQMRG